MTSKKLLIEEHLQVAYSLSMRKSEIESDLNALNCSALMAIMIGTELSSHSGDAMMKKRGGYEG